MKKSLFIFILIISIIFNNFISFASQISTPSDSDFFEYDFDEFDYFYSESLATPSFLPRSFRSALNIRYPEIVSPNEFDDPDSEHSYRESGIYSSYMDLEQYASFVMDYSTLDGSVKKVRYSFDFSSKDGNYKSYRVSFKKPSDLVVINSFYIDLNPKGMPKKGDYHLHLDFGDINDSLDKPIFHFLLSDRLNSNLGTRTKKYNLKIINSKFLWIDCSVQNFENAPIRYDSNYLSQRIFIHNQGGISLKNKNGEISFIFGLVLTPVTKVDSNGSTIIDNSFNTDNMGNNIADIADGINNVSQSQTLIYEKLVELVEHISNQLFAFWNQLAGEFTNLYYKLEHKLNKTLESIEVNTRNLGNGISRQFDRLIENDNRNTETVTNGYDRSDIDNSTNRLSDELNRQSQLENQVVEQFHEHLENFEYSNPITQYTNALSFISLFMDRLYNSSGLDGVISFSLFIMVAVLCIGLYRVKGH